VGRSKPAHANIDVPPHGDQSGGDRVATETGGRSRKQSEPQRDGDVPRIWMRHRHARVTMRVVRKSAQRRIVQLWRLKPGALVATRENVLDVFPVVHERSMPVANDSRTM
jgi:hypothetical protein